MDWKSCGFRARKNQKRAMRTEVEHVVTAWQIGHNRPCWREYLCQKKNGKHYRGRACCFKIDPEFRRAYTDLRNLFVVIGEVNGDRSHFRFGQWNQEPYQYGKCQSITDFKNRQFMPRPEARGIVARASLYMHRVYRIPISNMQLKLFELWDEQYPVGAREKVRNNQISEMHFRGT